jgi:hypothetical protein
MRSRRVRSSIKWWVELLSSDCWMSNRLNQNESQPDGTRQRSGRFSGSSWFVFVFVIVDRLDWLWLLKPQPVDIQPWRSVAWDSWCKWQSYQRLIVYLQSPVYLCIQSYHEILFESNSQKVKLIGTRIAWEHAARVGHPIAIASFRSVSIAVSSIFLYCGSIIHGRYGNLILAWSFLYLEFVSFGN